MVVRVSLALIANLCGLFLGCEKQEKPQQDSALQIQTVLEFPVPIRGSGLPHGIFNGSSATPGTITKN